MPATIKQMANRRKAHGITRRSVQSRLGCSESWVRWLEMGLYRGPAVEVWRDRYWRALEQLIEERKSK